jgi:hypothetical protein
MKKITIPAWIVYTQIKEKVFEFQICNTRNEARREKEEFLKFNIDEPKIKKCKIIID